MREQVEMSSDELRAGFPSSEWDSPYGHCHMQPRAPVAFQLCKGTQKPTFWVTFPSYWKIAQNMKQPWLVGFAARC